MEFKKVNRPRRQPTLTTPQRGAVPIVARPVPQSAPVNITTGKTPAKTTTTSHIRRLLFAKKTIITLGIVGCLVVGVLVHNSSNDSADAAAKRPTYTTVLPKGKSISELGGWKRVSPLKDNPVFAYADTIDGVIVSVSQQPLPQSFKNDTANQVAELARKFNAADKVAAGDISVYIGTSAKGPQSIIFAKGNLLVLIKSAKKVADASWARYAGSLN